MDWARAAEIAGICSGTFTILVGGAWWTDRYERRHAPADHQARIMAASYYPPEPASYTNLRRVVMPPPPPPAGRFYDQDALDKPLTHGLD